MISFKEFLVEKKVRSWDINIIDVKKAISLLNANCREGLQAISTGGLLYRGFKHKSAVMTIDTSLGARTSRDTNNIYQVMMEVSGALRDYPKRSQSLICSTDSQEASTYGAVMVIIPFDGTELVVSNHFDFLYNDVRGKLVEIGDDIDRLTDKVYFVLRALGLPKRGQYTVDDVPRFNQLIEGNLEGFIYEWNHYFETSERVMRKFAEQNKGRVFEALCDEICTPKSLKLKKQMFGTGVKRNVECWFSGKCVAIDIRLFAGIIHALKQNGHKIHPRVWVDLEHMFDFDTKKFGSVLDNDVLEYIRKNLK